MPHQHQLPPEPRPQLMLAGCAQSRSLAPVRRKQRQRTSLPKHGCATALPRHPPMLASLRTTSHAIRVPGISALRCLRSARQPRRDRQAEQRGIELVARLHQPLGDINSSHTLAGRVSWSAQQSLRQQYTDSISGDQISGRDCRRKLRIVRRRHDIFGIQGHDLPEMTIPGSAR